MGAVRELWWVIVMIGGPALCVVLWEKYQERKWRKYWRELTNWQKLGVAINEGLEQGYAEGVARREARERQYDKDRQIFKTVEEYRNDVG